MTNNRILPLTFIAAALIGTGAMVASAQDASPTTEPQVTTEAAPVQADVRGDRDHRGGKHGHRGGMFGGRGNSEIFATVFSEVDADGDGSVTQDEIDAYRTAKVAEVDASGDGALSIEEFDTLYREFTRSRMVDMFQDFDADGDGSISAEEMDTRFGDVVERMDRDDDGALTLQRGRRG